MVQYICFCSKDVAIVNKRVIKHVSIEKIRPFFVLMEEVRLPQSQVSLREGKTFHCKVLSKSYRNSELNFLVNFNRFYQP